MKKIDNRKNVLVFIFTYSWKRPEIPAEITGEEREAFEKQVASIPSDRFVTLVNVPFENIKANNAVIISEVNKLHTKLINGKPIKENQLMDIFQSIVKDESISKERENFILKDVSYYNVNDFTPTLIN